MKTNNPVLDTIIENQSEFINKWMDSAKKMQSTFTGNAAEADKTGKEHTANEGQPMKEFFDKQMDLLKTWSQASGSLFSQKASSPQEFFSNWFNQQSAFAKQMTDLTQDMQKNFMNSGKSVQDMFSGFSGGNNNFTNVYNSWLQAINASSESMAKNMNAGFGKDVFQNFMQGNQVFARLQEFFQPMMQHMQNGSFNSESFKNFFASESYRNLAKQMFGNLYDETFIKEVFDNGIKNLHEFFTSQNDLGKEYYSRMQDSAKNLSEVITQGRTDLFSRFTNVFSQTFEPMLKLVTPGKEKEQAEATIALLDRFAAYSLRQAELQALIQNTLRKGIEKVTEELGEKFSKADLTKISTQEIYSEWVKVNEKLLTELFASEDFSKIKGEALNLGLEVKKNFEQQFQSSLSHLPFVFKSEADELYKTIHELKKQVRELKDKVSLQNNTPAAELHHEEKDAKPRKK
jgi:polyhydroxyalkanoate synthase subunit PhaE